MKDNYLISVKDKAGNTFRINNLDERYLSGELVGIIKDKVIVKDINGNKFTVDKKDERYLSGELVSVHKNVKWSDDRKKKVLNKRIETIIKRRKLKYPEYDRIERDNQTKEFIVKSFCEHGDLRIQEKVFDTLYHNKTGIMTQFFCNKCRDKFIEDYEPSDEDIENNITDYLNLLSNTVGNHLAKEYYLKLYYPKIYKSLQTKYEKIQSWDEIIYLTKNKINVNDISKCQVDGCDNNVRFVSTSKTYTVNCLYHNHTIINPSYVSNKEIELREFVKTIYNGDILLNTKINSREADIYLPSFKLAIEFNGLYWHSAEYRDKNYHYDKLLKFNKKDINLLTIWEDDWDNKKEIIKSIIKNKINQTDTIIYGRKTEIRLVDNQNKIIFLKNNHIQGNCNSSINIGLFYDNELISLMTFGKKRMILGSKTSVSTYELLRFCSKLNYRIIGGASKLLKYFLRNHNPHQIISYANLDISKGVIYEKLGFSKVGHTGLNYWWVKDIKKYHRSNFMKHLLVKKGFNKSLTENEIMSSQGYKKLYGNGNIKYVLNL